MAKIKSVLRRRAFFGFLVLSSFFSVSAQSTIFNIPSTDVLDKDRFYIEGDFISHFDKYERGGFQSIGVRTVYGISEKLEVGANYFYTRTGSTSPKELQFNAKYQVISKEKSGFAAAGGAQLFVPLNRSAGGRVTGMIYANASKIFKPTRETRLTGGFYTMLGAERDSGTKSGVMLGIEQPITGKLAFTADWFSGKNRFGYAAAGFSYSFAKRHYFQIGYNFGNTGRGNNSLTALYGFTY